MWFSGWEVDWGGTERLRWRRAWSIPLFWSHFSQRHGIFGSLNTSLLALKHVGWYNLTVGRISIPEHHTTKGRVPLLRISCKGYEGLARQVSIRAPGGHSAQIYLDSLIEGLCLRPMIPTKIELRWHYGKIKLQITRFSCWIPGSIQYTDRDRLLTTHILSLTHIRSPNSAVVVVCGTLDQRWG